MGVVETLEPSQLGLRDRTLIGVTVFSSARVSAAIGMRVDDYLPTGKRWWFRLHEKGGTRHEVPAHRNAEDYLEPTSRRRASVMTSAARCSPRSAAIAS